MPKTTPRYTKHLHLLVTEDQYDFVKSQLNGGIGHHVRGMIDAHRGTFDSELSELEKQLSEVEPLYISLKKRIENIKTDRKKQEEDRIALEKRVEDAKSRLLIALEDKNWHVERIQGQTLKIYSDWTGIPASELREWLEEKAKTRGR